MYHFFNSSHGSFWMDSNFSGVFRRCDQFPIKLYFYIISFVSIIFCKRNPSTIFFIVPIIVIYSIYVFSIRGISHILIKVFKLFPSFTNINTPTTINWVFFIFFISTPIFYTKPSSIYDTSAQSMSLFKFTRNTTTRFRMPTKNTILSNFFNIPTITPTQNVSSASFIPSKLFHNSKSSKFHLMHRTTIKNGGQCVSI